MIQQIILRGPHSVTHKLIKSLKKILPNQLHKLIIVNSRKYLPSSECRIISLEPEVAVPQPCAGIFRLDFIGESTTKKWLDEVPAKCMLNAYLFKKTKSETTIKYEFSLNFSTSSFNKNY